MYIYIILCHECAIITVLSCIYKYKISYSAVRNNIPTYSTYITVLNFNTFF